MSITIRVGLVGLLAATSLAGCGKKAEEAATQEATSTGRGGRGAGRQRLQLVGLHRSGDAGEIHRRDGHQGQLRRVRFERSARDEAARRQYRLRRRRPVRFLSERQIKAGVFRKLDRSKLPNWSNLDTEILQRVALHDPGNEHSVNHMWGTDGIGYNEGKIKAIMPNAPLDSWDMIFDRRSFRNSRTAVSRCSMRRPS